ncbi:MAG: DUF721 domain-containing protein [Candidatus Korobacteraceae bacterium]
MKKLLADILNRFPAEQVPLEAWPFVCGKQVARRTQAVGFVDGVLRIEVPDAAWRAQLRELRGEYLAGLNQYGAARVNGIEFVLAGKAAPKATQERPPSGAANRTVKPRRTGASRNRASGNTAPADAKKASSGNHRKSNGRNKGNRK